MRMTMTRRKAVATAIGVVLAAAALIAYALLRGDPLSWSKPAELSSDGKRLSLVAIGGACADRTTVDVDESADRVVVTIRQLSLASACSDVGVPVQIVAELDEPLGDRDLVDGYCEAPEHARDAGCRGTAPLVERTGS